MLHDYRLAPASGGRPGRVVIFLHGVGDSGSGGLLSIGQIWQRDLPDCEFLCPDAPFPYDMAPPDFDDPRAVAWSAERAETRQRQWFSLQSFAPEAMLAGARMAAPILNEYIDHVLAARRLAPDKLALVGFSQGAIMALYVAPRRAAPVAGIVGYSGLLVGPALLKAEKKSAPPVLLVHGRMDDVVPYDAMGMAERALKEAGLPVSTLTCPFTGHGIDDGGVAEGLRFIKTIWTV